jgi:hypothetical protein
MNGYVIRDVTAVPTPAAWSGGLVLIIGMGAVKTSRRRAMGEVANTSDLRG